MDFLKAFKAALALSVNNRELLQYGFLITLYADKAH